MAGDIHISKQEFTNWMEAHELKPVMQGFGWLARLCFAASRVRVYNANGKSEVIYVPTKDIKKIAASLNKEEVLHVENPKELTQFLVGEVRADSVVRKIPKSDTESLAVGDLKSILAAVRKCGGGIGDILTKEEAKKDSLLLNIDFDQIIHNISWPENKSLNDNRLVSELYKKYIDNHIKDKNLVTVINTQPPPSWLKCIDKDLALYIIKNCAIGEKILPALNDELRNDTDVLKAIQNPPWKAR